MTQKQEQQMVTITKRQYDTLQQESKILNHLYSIGVDNWEGYQIPWEDDEEGFEDDVDNEDLDGQP